MSNSRSDQNNDTLGIDIWLQDDGYFSDSSMMDVEKPSTRSGSNSCYSSSSVSSSRLSLFQTPQKINCERENTFAELAIFVKEELIGRLGRVCPPSSPVKGSKSFFAPAPELIDMRLDYEKAIKKWDEFTNNNDQACGRNYSAMMQACKAFNKQVATVNVNMLRKKLKLIDFDIPEKTLLLAGKSFHLVQFIMMLYFMRKYPSYPVESIYNSIQANRAIDVYVVFKAYDNYLYERALTSTAAEPYLFEKQLRQDFGLRINDSSI